MSVKKGEVIELLVSDMAFGGRGLAKVDGMAVFIDGAVAGDRVRARVFKKKKSFAEARVVEILDPSEHRVEPRCEYASWCGGCKWQFLDYAKQLEYKRNHVVESLSHIGNIQDVTVHPTLASKHIFGYRNKMEFSCSESRWLLPHELSDPEIEKGMGIGLHVPGTFSKVIDIKACHIQPEMGNKLLGFVREYIKSSGEPVYGLKSHEGFWRFVMLRHSYHEDQWMVNLVTAQDKPEVVQPLADALREAFPEVASVMNNITSRKAGIAVGESEKCLAGKPYITDRLGEYTFHISANSFFQTNTPGAEALYSKVEEYAGLTGSERVIDLYSGTGTIPIWLSKGAQEITGLEIVPSAIEDAAENCRRNDVTNCRFVLGDVRHELPDVDVKPDVMIIDPPRAGMHKEVVQRVAELCPERIVYVSCNPATLARDLEMLKAHYEICEVQPVDMFPHTFHIEAVARLERKA
ncbi:MAG: 23S rRNA (uracil(1939)-C(5))-methyltransferase RlmD [Desulfobacterales bacterium]|nr:23S rRNA (uracil(1939)-C(5))-methyltransferase RlmD [Desulfobacterales bacterium]